MSVAIRPLPARPEYALASAASPSFHFGEAFYPAPLRIADHAHKNPSMTFILQGSLTESYPRSREENCLPCSILFRPPGEKHRDRMGDRGSRNLEIELTHKQALDVLRVRELFVRAFQASHPRLAAIGQQVSAELRVHDTAQPVILEGLALELLGIAARLLAGKLGHRPPPPWLVRVRELLQDSFRDSLRVADMAAVAGVHPVYLARAFRRYYGVTPGSYLRRLRLAWAAEELSRTSRPLIDIAASAGFADQSHFTRAFKQQFGTSPGRLRRTLSR